MKRVKKILNMMLCSVVIIGGSNLSLVKVNAQTIDKNNVSIQQVNTRSTTTKSDDKWVTTVAVRLKDKLLPFSKCFWHLELACNNEGNLVLRGGTGITKRYTFDDTYHWVYYKNGKTNTDIVFRGLNNVDAGLALSRAVTSFNNAKIHVDDIIAMYGENSNDSVRFENKAQPDSSFASSIIRKYSQNDYTQGYRGINRFDYGLRVEDKGLYEVNFKH